MTEDNFLHPVGVYDPNIRAAFTNITDEEFVSAWGGQPIKVPAGRTVELTHHLAVKLTKELVDKIMIGEAALDKATNGKGNAYYQSPKGMNLGVPAAREIWEKKICRQLEVDEESPEIQVMRAQIRQEVMQDMQNSQAPKSASPSLPNSINEFADIKGGDEPKKPKAPIKLKEVK